MKSLFRFYFHYFYLSGNSFFRPIMLNILLQVWLLNSDIIHIMAIPQMHIRTHHVATDT